MVSSARLCADRDDGRRKVVSSREHARAAFFVFLARAALFTTDDGKTVESVE
jgi:hypothetical protein